MLSTVEIDTAHFKGNFPEFCELHAVHSAELIPQSVADDQWSVILPRTRLGPHRQHYFQLVNTEMPYTHVKLIIFPDGGIKRVRVLGRRLHGVTGVSGAAATSQTYTDGPAIESEAQHQASPTSVNDYLGPAFGASARAGPPAIPALPLTAEAFAPFGAVIQAYADTHAVPAPRTTRVTSANQGSARKFHKLALLGDSYAPDAGATPGISVYRCSPISLSPSHDAGDAVWEVKLLERHPCTTQAFIPMGGAPARVGDTLANPGTRYLVVVALNGQGDKPDLSTMRAFVASAGQGIMYNAGIWRKS